MSVICDTCLVISLLSSFLLPATEKNHVRENGLCKFICDSYRVRVVQDSLFDGFDVEEM